MMGILNLFKRGDKLSIPKYTTIVENKVFLKNITERSGEQLNKILDDNPFDNREIIVISRYTLPVESEIIAYLNYKANTVNHFVDALAYSALQNSANQEAKVLESLSPIDSLLLSNQDYSRRIAKNDPEMISLIKSYFPDDLDDSLEPASNYLSLRAGRMTIDDVEAICFGDRFENSTYWLSNFKMKKWDIDIKYDHHLPKKSLLKRLLADRAKRTSSLRGRGLAGHILEIERAISSIYRWKLDSSIFLELSDLSGQAIHDLSYLTLAHLCQNGEILKQYHSLFFWNAFNLAKDEWMPN